ncbi:MAG: hypothetical protein D4R74_13425 [Betaproteobacteria bacterium]|nr:MAG: hypothetical protein D4R74_13425 [Betaproteobacteria bacterium]
MESVRFGLTRCFLNSVLALCVLQGSALAAQFQPGWTLAGNGRNAVIDVPLVFGSKSAPVANVSDAVTTIWKWDAINLKWAFFTPTMDLDQVATYAASKGYSVLKTIFPGEGYWVNASKSTAIADSLAPAFVPGPWRLTGGWNMVASGANMTAPQYSTSIAPFTATTVWAWDSANLNWYFYTPSMDSTQLASYIAQKNYLNFGGRVLGDATGFWVNRAAVTGSPTAGLAALDQAKQMVSELRTTFHAFSNTTGTGSLDDQARRMGSDLNGVVMPGTHEVLRRTHALAWGTDIFRKVKRGETSGFTFNATTLKYTAWENEYQFSNANTRFPGAGFVTCATNALASSASTAVTSVTCSVYSPRYPVFINGNTTSDQFIVVTITETAADQYAFTAQGKETTTVNGTPTTASIGALYSGTLSKTIDANGNPQAIVLAGNFPALSQGVATVRVSLNLARSLQTAGTPYSTYRYTATGSIAGLDAAGASLFSYGLETGSYYDNLEDSLTNAKANGVQALNLVGVMQTRGTRFNGTVNAKAFTADADGQSYIPTDVSFTGSISDISAGGSGAIFNVTLTGAVSNYSAYRSSQPTAGTNYVHSNLTLNGTVQMPSRPVMALTLSGTATGPTTEALSGQYTYDNGLVITIAGTRDTSNTAGRTFSFTNQDGIVLTLPQGGNGAISKSGTTLGQISNGMVNYTDGSFESLN